MIILKEIYMAVKTRRFNVNKWTWWEWLAYRIYHKYLYPNFGIGQDQKGKTMKYIIDEEELRRVSGYIVPDDWIEKYIKSKEGMGLECIAEGVVDVFKYNTLVGKLSMGPEKCEFVEKINVYSGKNIKLYVEVAE